MRVDLTFSFYIILFAYLYIFNIIKYNPYIWIIIITLFTVVLMIIMLFNNVNLYVIFIIFITTLICKISLLFVVNHNNIYDGFKFYCYLFLIYYLWLLYNDTNIYDIYIDKFLICIINKNYENTLFLKYLINI